jgi:hypothetical protein
MKVAHVKMSSVSPYSSSKVFTSDKLPREKPDDYEERCWRERLHVMPDGKVKIPGMSFKIALELAAKFRGEKIKGKGQATYSKRFTAGVLVLEDLPLPDLATEVIGERLFVPSDGVRGGGKRVWKRFPMIPTWSGQLDFHIMDDETISEEVFLNHLEEAGRFIGIGRWRPERGGMYGRFNVDSVKWSAL